MRAGVAGCDSCRYRAATLNAQLESRLIHYGVHPAVIASHIAAVTDAANPARITPSRRVNKSLRSTLRVVGTLAAGVAYLTITR